LRTKFIITVILILVGGLIGCRMNFPSQKDDRSIIEQEPGDQGQSDPETSDQSQTDPGFIILETNDNDGSKVIIKGYYDEPFSLNDKDTIVLHGLNQGEFIEFIVKGEIRNFKHLELKWDETKDELVEKRIINQLDRVSNQTIVIKTYMPEGIPSEKIKWESASGKPYEFLIAEYNLDE